MTTLENILSDLNYDNTKISIRHEPQDSKIELLKFERLFGTDTINVIQAAYDDFNDVPVDVASKWRTLYYDFKLFGGHDSDLNSIRKKSYQFNYKKAVSLSDSLLFCNYISYF